jgi:hypothetical protein
MHSQIDKVADIGIPGRNSVARLREPCASGLWGTARHLLRIDWPDIGQ